MNKKCGAFQYEKPKEFVTKVLSAPNRGQAF